MVLAEAEQALLLCKVCPTTAATCLAFVFPDPSSWSDRPTRIVRVSTLHQFPIDVPSGAESRVLAIRLSRDRLREFVGKCFPTVCPPFEQGWASALRLLYIDSILCCCANGRGGCA